MRLFYGIGGCEKAFLPMRSTFHLTETLKHLLMRAPKLVRMLARAPATWADCVEPGRALLVARCASSCHIGSGFRSPEADPEAALERCCRWAAASGSVTIPRRTRARPDRNANPAGEP